MKSEVKVSNTNMGIKRDGNAVVGTMAQSGVRRMFSTNVMVVIAMFSALSYVLMLLKFPVAYLGFLEFELSDIPALVAGLAYGPLAAVVIELIKNLVKVVTNTYTGGVGEFANFIVSSSYMAVACSIFKYSKIKGGKKLVTSFVLGTVAMTITGALMNLYVLLPLYSKVLTGGMDGIVNGAAKTIPFIHNAVDLVVIGICPFNIVKGAYIALFGYAIYRILKRYLQNF